MSDRDGVSWNDAKNLIVLFTIDEPTAHCLPEDKFVRVWSGVDRDGRRA